MPVPLGGKLELCGDLVCRGRAICLGKKIRRAFRSGFCAWGEKKQPKHPPHAHSKNEKNRIVP